MPDPTPMTFFAGITTDDEGVEPRQIRVANDLQQELSDLFEKQAEAFLKDDFDRVDFNPKGTYRLEREEVFVIRTLALPPAISDAVLKPHETADFSLSERPLPRVATIFGATAGRKKVGRILFQQFRTTQLLDRKFTLFANKNTFHRIEQDGLSIGHELAAIYDQGNLYFRSFAIVSRFFDLAQFEPTPTPAEISGFLADPLFHIESEDVLFEMIETDSWLQRRVASIQSTGILKAVTPRMAANKAKAFDVEIKVAKPDGQDKIRLPTVKKDLKRVVKFLNEEFFHGELSNSKYETNSLRRL